MTTTPGSAAHTERPAAVRTDSDLRSNPQQAASRALRTSRKPGDASRPPSSGRAEGAAEQVAALVGAAAPGSRLGTKEELRTRCGVSVGTFNEALRLLQSRGLVTVKPGPGGGLFSAEQSPMVRLGNSFLALDAQQSDVANAVRIRDALDPLLIEDALWHASPADISGLSCREVPAPKWTLVLYAARTT